MRRVVLIAIVLSATSAFVPNANADHKPKSFCSESGDVCQSVKKRNGQRRLTIGLGAKYFNRYRLCVQAPDGSKECIQRRITDQGAQYGDSVNWSNHFSDEGAGDYKVIWRQSGDRLGAVLGFHV